MHTFIFQAHSYYHSVLFTTIMYTMRAWSPITKYHYNGVIISAIASQITGVSTSTVCPGADQREHQSSASLAFVRGIHQSPVNSPHKRTVTRKMFPFDDIILITGARSIVETHYPLYGILLHNFLSSVFVTTTCYFKKHTSYKIGKYLSVPCIPFYMIFSPYDMAMNFH